jgi:hypothetical protein
MRGWIPTKAEKGRTPEGPSILLAAMRREPRQVVLKSDDHYGRYVPPSALGFVLDRVEDQLRGAISLAFRGRSVVEGRRPAWLARASDVRFLGLEGKDETILHFEAPRFADSAAELYEQRELWPSTPPEDWTGFEVFSSALRDLAVSNQDSDRYDLAFLRKLARFGRAAGAAFDTAFIQNYSTASPSFEVLDKSVIQSARRLADQTPPSRRVRVAGTLDMVRVSTQTIALKLAKGEEVRGVVDNAGIERLSSLLNRTVVLHGRAVYRPSGRVFRLDVDAVADATPEDLQRWSQIPGPLSAPSGKPYRRPQTSTSGVNAIIGRWPGEHSDQEILAALDELR